MNESLLTCDAWQRLVKFLVAPFSYVLCRLLASVSDLGVLPQHQHSLTTVNAVTDVSAAIARVFFRNCNVADQQTRQLTWRWLVFGQMCSVCVWQWVKSSD